MMPWEYARAWERKAHEGIDVRAGLRGCLIGCQAWDPGLRPARSSPGGQPAVRLRPLEPGPQPAQRQLEPGAESCPEPCPEPGAAGPSGMILYSVEKGRRNTTTLSCRLLLVSGRTKTHVARALIDHSISQHSANRMEAQVTNHNPNPDP